MKFIVSYHRQLYFCEIDKEDYQELSRHSWCIVIGHNGKKYAARTVKSKCIFMHRQLMNAQDGELIDHKDNNGLNNTRQNLRRVTDSLNNANREKTGGSSQYKGVYWDKDRNKWVAQIKSNQVTKYLGSFVIETDAALAYNREAIKLWGDHARINPL